jgi:hypothetical protein
MLATSCVGESTLCHHGALRALRGGVEKWPDAHGAVVGAAYLPRAVHSLERMSTPPCQARGVRRCTEQR